LNQLIKVLDFQYKHISEALAALAAMQGECAKTEDEFNQEILEYANRIGAANIPYKYMKYSSHVIPKLSPEGEITLELTE